MQSRSCVGCTAHKLRALRTDTLMPVDNVTSQEPSRDPGMSAPPAIRRRALPTPLAAAAVFLASAGVLVLEVVGLRLVGPYLGVTLQTSSAVIGIALGAIAYGAWTGGWLADRVDPRRLLAPAFVLAAAATAITLPSVRWAGELLRGSASAGILLLTAMTVFVPAALLSAITPLVVKLQLSDVSETGRVVASSPASAPSAPSRRPSARGSSSWPRCRRARSSYRSRRCWVPPVSACTRFCGEWTGPPLAHPVRRRSVSGVGQ